LHHLPLHLLRLPRACYCLPVVAGVPAHSHSTTDPTGHIAPLCPPPPPTHTHHHHHLDSCFPPDHPLPSQAGIPFTRCDCHCPCPWFAVACCNLRVWCSELCILPAISHAFASLCWWLLCRRQQPVKSTCLEPSVLECDRVAAAAEALSRAHAEGNAATAGCGGEHVRLPGTAKWASSCPHATAAPAAHRRRPQA
jgi:hypothetical protein